MEAGLSPLAEFLFTTIELTMSLDLLRNAPIPLAPITLTVLSENRDGPDLPGEFGLSILIEADIKVLLDTGSSDLFARNAKKMGKDLSQVPTVVLSHGHWDHGNGLGALQGKTLVGHPGIFRQRYRREDGSPLGLALGREALAQRYTFRLSSGPFPLSKQIYWLGEIPRKGAFANGPTPYAFADGSDDFVPDDSGLALVTPDGLVVVTGCAHSGISNILERAVAVARDPRIRAVVGGFHLKAEGPLLSETLEALERFKVGMVYPGHCVTPDIQEQLVERFSGSCLVTGTELHF